MSGVGVSVAGTLATTGRRAGWASTWPSGAAADAGALDAGSVLRSPSAGLGAGVSRLGSGPDSTLRWADLRLAAVRGSSAPRPTSPTETAAAP